MCLRGWSVEMKKILRSLSVCLLLFVCLFVSLFFVLLDTGILLVTTRYSHLVLILYDVRYER